MLLSPGMIHLNRVSEPRFIGFFGIAQSFYQLRHAEGRPRHLLLLGLDQLDVAALCVARAPQAADQPVGEVRARGQPEGGDVAGKGGQPESPSLFILPRQN